MKSDNINYSIPLDKLDKFLPEDPEIQEEYYLIIELEPEQAKIELKEFFELNINEERFANYLPKGGTLDGFINCVINENNIQ